MLENLKDFKKEKDDDLKHTKEGRKEKQAESQKGSKGKYRESTIRRAET